MDAAARARDRRSLRHPSNCIGHGKLMLQVTVAYRSLPSTAKRSSFRASRAANEIVILDGVIGSKISRFLAFIFYLVEVMFPPLETLKDSRSVWLFLLSLVKTCSSLLLFSS